MNIKHQLEQLGLSDNAAQVYLTLLELKKATVLELAQKSKVARSNIYNKLEELKKTNLVSEAIEGKKKYWTAEAPKNLTNLIQDKQKIITDIIPQLTQSFEQDKYKPKIKFYEGKEGVKKLIEESLSNTERTMRTIGDYYNVLLKCVTQRYLKNYWQKRVGKKIFARMIDSQKNLSLYQKDRDFGDIANIKYTRELRLVPKNFIFKMFIITFDDKVLFFAPPEEGYSFIFESPAFASTIKNWFDLLWKIAEPLRGN